MNLKTSAIAWAIAFTILAMHAPVAIATAQSAGGAAPAGTATEPAGRAWVVYLCATVLVLLNTVWLVLVALQLPGNWLMVLSAGLLALWQREMFSIWTLVAAVLLAVLGELIEFLSGLVGAQKAGATRWGTWGGLIGAIVGAVVGTFAIPVPIVGSLIGACIGAAAGAFLLELGGAQRTMPDSLWIGLGAGAGRLAGAIAKLGVAVAIWLVLAVAAFWP